MNSKFAAITIEQDKWESEKDDIKAITKVDSEIVNLNIGGTHHISTDMRVLQLCPESNLAKIFSGMHELKKIDDEVFLDRDGVAFETLINYLRNDRKVFPEFVDKNSEN